MTSKVYESFHTSQGVVPDWLGFVNPRRFSAVLAEVQKSPLCLITGLQGLKLTHRVQPIERPTSGHQASFRCLIGGVPVNRV